MSTSRVIKGIKSLELNFFDAPKQETIMEFVNILPSLTELDLSCCLYQWDDEGIHKVTSKLPNLRKINLSYNSQLTDKTLDVLSSNCPKLESVNFRQCKKFTAEALYKFFCNNPQLSSVNIPHSISKIGECVQKAIGMETDQEVVQKIGRDPRYGDLLLPSIEVHLIEGIIDQVEGTVYISWEQPRVLGIPQIKSLRDRLDSWLGKVHTALLSVKAETPDLVIS
ncbi:hypothetical protein QQ045_020852 [Rhodiola kirilowii]